MDSIFKINSYSDLRIAYRLFLKFDHENGRGDLASALKREIRAFVHRPLPERRIVRDDGINGFVELLPLPAYIETIDEANNYFKNYEYRSYSPSAYDCTGQIFTSWYKVFARDGRFWAYHCISVDI